MMMMLMKTRSETTDEQDPISIVLGGIVYDASMISTVCFVLRSTIYHTIQPCIHACITSC